MPTTSIGQLLQIATPTRASDNSSNTPDTDRGRFQEHLQLAAPAEKSPSESNLRENHAEDLDTGANLTTDQEQEPSLEQDETVLPLAEVEESLEQVPEEIASLIATDEITLSAAVVIAAETVDEGEIEPDADSTNESPLTVQPTQNVDGLGVGTSTNLATDENESPLTADIILSEPEQADSEQETELLSDKEQSSIAAAVKPVDSRSPGKLADENQDNPQELQTNRVGELSNQDYPKQPSQQFSDEDHSQQSRDSSGLENAEFGEAEVGKAEVESATPVENKQSTAHPSPIETLTQESTNTGTESETAPAPTAATPGLTTSTSNDSATAIDRPPNVLSVEQPTTEVKSSAEVDSSPTVDRTRFVQRVSGAIRAAKDQDGLIQLKLSPPELGTLRIAITVKQGALTAQLEAETTAARNVLLDSLPALRERLAEQEIRIEKFDVDVRDESRQQQQNSSAEDRHSNSTSTRKNSDPDTSRSKTQKEATPIPSIPPQQNDVAGGLDVMV